MHALIPDTVAPTKEPFIPHGDAHLGKGWREQFVHLLRQPDVLDAAIDALDARNDHHWVAKLILYSITSIADELIAESEAAIAAYEAKFGEAEAAWRAAQS